MNPARFLLRSASFFFLLVAAFYNPLLLMLFHPLHPATIPRMVLVEIIFFSIGLCFYFMAVAMERNSSIRVFFEKPLHTNLLLSFLALFTPLATAELSLRPFTNFQYEWTTIFMKDEKLGWKFKPDTYDRWGNVMLHINRKGLRGPEIPYTKPPSTKRILFLGDSVTFGFQLEKYEQTYPYLIQEILTRTHKPTIQAVNAGVDGYSPWQESIYLKEEGILYRPDLVVVGFVLNDVTERFRLSRFGGNSEGTQLGWTIPVDMKWLVQHSSIAFFTFKQIMLFLHRKEKVEMEKRKEILAATDLVQHANRADVRYAWKGTLEDLSGICEFCKKRNIPVFLIVFPYRFQFDDIQKNSVPQKILMEFGETHQVPVLDLMPLMAGRLTQEKRHVSDYFLDYDHLTALGNQLAAELIASFILEQNVLKLNEEAFHVE